MSAAHPSLTGGLVHPAFALERVQPVKGHERPLSWLAMGMMLIDVVVIVGAFMAAYWVRFILPDDEQSALGMHEYARIGAWVALTAVLLLALQGVYGRGRRFRWTSRLHAVVSAISTALIIAVTISYVLGDQRISRLWFAAGWSFAALGLMVWRTAAERLMTVARAAISPANRAIVVGANPLGHQIAQELAGQYEVIGYVDTGSTPAERSDLPILGTISDLPRLVSDRMIDDLIIALDADRRDEVISVVARGFDRRVNVMLIPELADILPDTFDLHQIGGRRYIGFSPVADVNWLKRVTDLVLTVAGLLVIWPIVVAAALAIKLDSPGPVLYWQDRVGKHGRIFRLYKFRSMYVDADARRAELMALNEASGPLFKMRDDPRVTRVGRFLRRTSLDELPQLWNVLLGEMSLVGPRPALPSEVERYEEWQLGRLRGAPGLTGLWQVSGRSEVSFHQMVHLDLHYLRNWSLGLDVEILWKTLPAVLSNRGAY